MNFISDYETWFDELLPIIIETENAVFIDIGANVGQTMLKVLPQYPHIKYFGIEPNGHCVKYIHALAKANNFANVTLFECALSDNEGKAELLTRYHDDILATTTHSFRKFTKYALSTTVPVTTGDTLLKSQNLTDITVIKIDIEGGEAQAIDGLLGSLKKFQPYIICEILPLQTEDQGVTDFRISSAAKILSQLKELNYQCINVVTRDQVTEITNLSSSLEACNYLFVPRKRVAVFNLN